MCITSLCRWSHQKCYWSKKFTLAGLISTEYRFFFFSRVIVPSSTRQSISRVCMGRCPTSWWLTWARWTSRRWRNIRVITIAKPLHFESLVRMEWIVVCGVPERQRNWQPNQNRLSESVRNYDRSLYSLFISTIKPQQRLRCCWRWWSLLPTLFHKSVAVVLVMHIIDVVVAVFVANNVLITFSSLLTHQRLATPSHFPRAGHRHFFNTRHRFSCGRVSLKKKLIASTDEKRNTRATYDVDSHSHVNGMTTQVAIYGFWSDTLTKHVAGQFIVRTMALAV